MCCKFKQDTYQLLTAVAISSIQFDPFENTCVFVIDFCGSTYTHKQFFRPGGVVKWSPPSE
jgi:hypothetical protein